MSTKYAPAPRSDKSIFAALASLYTRAPEKKARSEEKIESLPGVSPESVVIFQSPPGGAVDPDGAFGGSPSQQTTLGQQVTVTCTAQELVAITATPTTWIPLIPAPGAGNVTLITSIAAFYTFVSAAFTAADPVQPYYGTSAISAAGSVNYAAVLAEATNQLAVNTAISGFNTASEVIADYVNQPVSLGSAGAVAEGGGSLVLVINYRIYTFETLTAILDAKNRKTSITTRKVRDPSEYIAPMTIGASDRRVRIPTKKVITAPTVADVTSTVLVLQSPEDIDADGAFSASPLNSFSIGSTTTTAISAEQILNLATAPITIVPAPTGTNQFTFLTQLTAYFTAGTEAYTFATGSTECYYEAKGGAAAAQFSISNDITSATNQITTFPVPGPLLANGGIPLSTIFGQPVVFAIASGGPFLAGNGTLVIVANYQTLEFV